MKVWPKNDDVRRLIKHPTARGFRKEGPADWPADVFTFRLLQDGDITSSEPAPDPSKPTPPVTPKPPPSRSSGSGSDSTS
jgi:hypothetical protein